MDKKVGVYCPVCKMENLPGMAYCAYCHTPLTFNTGTGQITADVSSQPEESSRVEWNARTVDISLYRGIVIVVENSPEVIKVINNDPFILGRNLEDAKGKNGEQIIDLSPYGAYEKGVSRQHVMIFKVEGKYAICDLSSMNGTWLNQSRLAAGRFYPLMEENEVRLGHLLLKIMVFTPSNP